VKQFFSNLGGSARDNPLPVALVGIGVAWLMVTGRSSGASRSEAETSPGMKEKIGSAKQHLGEGLHSARERASHLAHSTRETAAHVSQTAQKQMERARSGIDYMMREQPLALGAIGLAVGAVLAAAAPRTQKEDELMGEAKDRLADRVAEKASAVAGKATEAAQEVRPGMTKPEDGSGSGGAWTPETGRITTTTAR
jgi:ElaB/YqjD/DUF883 family membrane-anchored ribosome-binding protein